MKKFLTSSVVIIAFTVYSIYQRTFSTKSIPAISPKIIDNLPTTAPSLIPPTPTTTPVPQNTPFVTQKPNLQYKDGVYTGSIEDAFYGNVQIQVNITNGRMANIQYLMYPNDRNTSIEINSQANPVLIQEAIQAQSAQVDIVSGATDSSQAFIRSMQSALNKAKFNI